MQPELRPCNWSCGQVYLSMLQLAADLLALCTAGTGTGGQGYGDTTGTGTGTTEKPG